MTPEAPPGESPLVSFVLVSWNRRDDLRVALDSIHRQTHAPREIIVVDNGSTDGSVEMLREQAREPITLYRAEKNLGASVARNIALRLASGSLIAFMDSDAELLGADGLERLVAHLSNNDQCAAVAPAIYLDADRKEPWFFGGYTIRGGYCDQVRAREETESPEYLSTCFSLWRSDWVKELGGFDPALPYGFEDNDLSARALRRGYTLEVAPDIAVQHHLSAVSRIRPEAAGWSHFLYDELARNRLQARALGFWGYLAEEAWQWTAPGRLQRRHVYLNAPLRWRQKLGLYAWPALRTLLTYPSIAAGKHADWISASPFDAERVKKVG